MHRRIRSLAVVEGVNAVLLPAVVLTWLGTGPPPGAGVLVALLALALSLVAGSMFWFRRARGRVPRGWSRTCAVLLAVAGLLALAGAAVCVVELLVAEPGPGARTGPLTGLAVAAFAAAEIVNYRFVQISAGGWRLWRRGRTRRPHLAIELARPG